MTWQMFLINVGLIFVFMSLAFTVAYKRKRIDTVDISWGLGFVVIAWSVYIQQPTTRSAAIAILVTVWGFRLANHIWRRSRKHSGDDPRYIEITSKWSGPKWPRAYYSIFLLQGGLMLAVGLPIFTASGEAITGLEWLTVVGVLLWATGFVIEAISDRQLALFLSDKNRPKVLKTGLWRYSRHPNYFGELLQWWAIGLIACQASWGWIGLAGPALISYLIIFVSGIPPIERRRIKDPEYIQYQRETSSLVLWPPKS